MPTFCTWASRSSQSEAYYVPGRTPKSGAKAHENVRNNAGIIPSSALLFRSSAFGIFRSSIPLPGAVAILVGANYDLAYFLRASAFFASGWRPRLSTPAAWAARRAGHGLENKEIKLGEDEPGCKDSTLLPRIPGCSIIQCDTKEADTLEIQVGVSTDGAVQKEAMDGASEVIYYLCPSKVTLSNIAKTSDTALTKAGFKTVFNGKDDDDQPLVTALKDTQWVQISTYMYNEYSAYVFVGLQGPA